MRYWIYWIFFPAVVFLFGLLVPPFQKPDEQTHFYRSMALVTGQFVCTSDTGRPESFLLSQSVYQFPKTMMMESIIMRFDAKFPIGLLKARYPYRNDRSATDAFRYCSLPFISYVPYAISALTTLPFDNLLLSFYSMRMVASVLFIITIIAGYRIIPKRYGLLYLFLSANPMVLHQATAVSYDAILLNLMFLIFPLWLAVMDEKTGILKHGIILVACVLLSTIVKPGYWILVGLLIPLILKIRLKKSVYPAVIGGVLFFIFATSYVVFGSDFFRHMTDSMHPQSYIILHDPWYVLTVFGATLRTSLDELLQGMVGLFGWIDYKLPLYGMALYIFIGGMVSYDYIKNQTKPLPAWVSAFMGFLCLSTVLLLFLYFYRAATPFGYKTVVGIQGRYFLPLLPFGVLAVLEMIVQLRYRKLLPIAGMCVGIISIFAVGRLISMRYYDYSRNFSNPQELILSVKNGETDPSTLIPITIDSKKSYMYPAQVPGYKIGGMEVIVGNELEVSVPYRFSIQDRSCRKTYYEGYMNELRDIRLSFLKGDHDVVTEQFFPITEITEDTLCVTFAPVGTREQGTYLKLLGDREKPILRFLYIAK